MNQKIKELMKEANLQPYYKEQEKDIDKFAELIIKECRMSLKPELRDMISRGKAYDLIKEHFGIE